MTWQQIEREKFEEVFGKADPEFGSIGRMAGCDDCGTNVQWREEIKEWFISRMQAREQEIREEMKPKCKHNSTCVDGSGMGCSEFEMSIYKSEITVVEVLQDLLKEFNNVQYSTGIIKDYAKSKGIDLLTKEQ